jgi:hypothetical protein
VTLWTPSGERPLRPEPEEPPSSGAPDAGTSGAAGDQPDLTEEELAELGQRMAEIQGQMLATPAEVIVANHCIALYELAVLHLRQPSPNLDEARLAIDALAGLVEGLGNRLGENERPLRDALAQLQLAFVQAKGITTP